MFESDIKELLKRGSKPTKAFLEALNEQEKKLEEIGTGRFTLGEVVKLPERRRPGPEGNNRGRW